MGARGGLFLFILFLLSILLLANWVIKRKSKRSWKVKLLSIYFSVAALPWVFVFVAGGINNASPAVSYIAVISGVFIVFSGLIVPFISNWLIKRAST